MNNLKNGKGFRIANCLGGRAETRISRGEDGEGQGFEVGKSEEVLFDLEKFMCVEIVR